MYKLLISAKAKKELKKISTIHQKAILIALKEIKEDPLVTKALTRDLTGRYSYKVGVYRIIYTVNKKDKKVFIITAGHRAVIYN